jgi:hypothetical protein
MARSRPAQGANSLNPKRPSRPAYKSDAAPVVKSVGTLSKPVPNRWGTLKRLVADETPKVVQR